MTEVTEDGAPGVAVKTPRAVSAHRAKPKAKRTWTRRAAQPEMVDVEIEVDAPPASIRQMKLERRSTGNIDEYYIDPADIPDGMSFQFLTETVAGQPQTARMMKMKKNHWTPVPSERYPGKYMPDDYRGPIKINEQVLMERPKYLTEEAEREEYLKALSQVSEQEAAIGNAPPGTGPRNHDMVRPNVQRTHAPVMVSDD